MELPALAGGSGLSVASRRQVRWLRGELPDLVAGGVLDEAAATRLREHYTEGGSGIGATSVFGVLGAALIGMGVILLLAHNWEDLSRGARAVLSLGLLVAAQGIAVWGAVRRPDSIAWSEGSAVFLVAALIASIALIAQTYHLPGSLPSFLATSLILSFAIPYLLRSRAVAALYLIGTLVWVTSDPTSDNPFGHLSGYLVFVALIAPFLIARARESGASVQNYLLGGVAVVTLPIGLMIALQAWDDAFVAPTAAALASGIYAWGAGVRSSFARAAQVLGGLAVCVLAFVLSDGGGWKSIIEHASDVELRGLAGLTYAIALVAGGYALWRALAGGRGSVDAGRLLMGFGALVLLAQVMGMGTGSNVPPTLLLNAFTLALALVFLIEGVREADLPFANLGLLLLGALILARFSDLNWSFTARGIAFIALGCLFLGVNVRIRRTEAI